MKFIKKYQQYEELNYRTYNNAANKLGKLGYEDRAKKLKNHANKIEWEKSIKNSKPFGECEIEIVNQYKYGSSEFLYENCYLELSSELPYYKEHLEDFKNRGLGILSFFIRFIPTEFHPEEYPDYENDLFSRMYSFNRPLFTEGSVGEMSLK